MSAVDLHSDSDDSDDGDYVPEDEEGKLSEEDSASEGSENEASDGNGDEETDGKLSKKRKRVGGHDSEKAKKAKTGAQKVEDKSWKDELLEAKRAKEEKEKTDALWEDFMKDVSCPVLETKKEEESKNESNLNAKSVSEEKKAATSSALKKEDDIMSFLEGGESSVVDSPSLPLRDREQSAERLTKPEPIKAASIPGGSQRGRGKGLLARGGLSQLMSGGQKMSVLEKSKLDWSSFKKAEGIEEDLKQHSGSRNSYVERQNFLERVDHRQFEKEKSVRDINRRRMQ